MFKNAFLALIVLVSLAGCSSRQGYYSGSVSPEEMDFRAEVGDRVYFGFDTDHLSHAAKHELNKQAAWLNQDANSNVHFVIEGHCDERGTREYNLALGERRANAVKRYLSLKGVSAHRMEVISYGKERPAAIGDVEEIHALNRRAVVNLK